jgi:hypothetical protein
LSANVAIGAVLAIGGLVLISAELGRDPMERVGFWLGLVLVVLGVLYGGFRRRRWY